MNQYIVPHVSAKIIMEVVKILAHSPHALNINDIIECLGGNYSLRYISDVLVACCQLKLLRKYNNHYICDEEDLDIIKRADRSELYLPFRRKLQCYAPFLLYADFLSKGYSSLEAASRAKGILKIRGSLRKMEKTLRNWGLYARLLTQDSSGLKLSISTEKLSKEYVQKLLKALEAELRAKLFTIDMLTPELYAYLDDKCIDISSLSAALLEYERRPRESAANACQTFEHFLCTLIEEDELKNLKGVTEIIDFLRNKKMILSNHVLIGHGLGGLRNITHHKVDKDSKRPWTITQHGALIAILLAINAMRSYFMYIKKGKQEF